MNIEAFLAAHGWADAARLAMTPDASSRSYIRLLRDGDSAILMQDPDGDVALFARLAEYLCGLGLSAPRILAMAPEAGLMLLEDLGDGLFARVAQARSGQEPALYAAAGQALAHLHRAAPATGLTEATPALLAQMVAPVFDFYSPATPEPDRAALTEALHAALARHAAAADVTILRDFHAENLLWLPDRAGPARTGLLDFQDALQGHRAYDMVSLLHDARRAVSEAAEEAALAAYLQASGQAAGPYCAAMMVLGVQRNLRILGIFARLADQRGKPGYLRLMPRVWQHIQRELEHPALAEVAPLLRRAVPAPVGQAA
ncbi:MAG: phosphotransferase [Roseivivax sp.]|nr:phosphotransferase [Roseivivax sp.]